MKISRTITGFALGLTTAAVAREAEAGPPQCGPKQLRQMRAWGKA